MKGKEVCHIERRPCNFVGIRRERASIRKERESCETKAEQGATQRMNKRARETRARWASRTRAVKKPDEDDVCVARAIERKIREGYIREEKNERALTIV